MIEDLIGGEEIELTILDILDRFHVEGPVNTTDLETLAYCKKFHPEILKKHESSLMYYMGLFYKTSPPNSLAELTYDVFSRDIIDKTERKLTPVQANAYSSILEKKYFSFSAPTSAGKSYLLREVISDYEEDIIIIVPSRALIAEYIQEIQNLFHEDKSVLILQFIDNINTHHTRRRIFVLTPERGAELFRLKHGLNIGLFLLDEAQISEENIRGLRFDAFVRRINREFTEAKKVFAHPFVDNPGAQLLKHGIREDSDAKMYPQHTVGKIYIQFNKKTKQFSYFSPNRGEEKYTKVGIQSDPVEDVLTQGGTLLIDTVKRQILDGDFKEKFGKYIDICEPIENETAINMINELNDFVGSQESPQNKHSEFVELMRIGVVSHHGSMPLKARLLIEKFVKAGYAKICFATSTLRQGINMPFDIVWVDNFGGMTALDLRNLIGRSGRTTNDINHFNYGYMIINTGSVTTFKRHYDDSYELAETSKLDDEVAEVEEDYRDLVEALKDNSFDDNLHLTQSQLTRLGDPDLDTKISYVLDKVLIDNSPIDREEYASLRPVEKKKVRAYFGDIYCAHLRRNELQKGEKAVLSTAINILLWRIQARSFKEIVSLRYSYLTRRDEQRAISRNLRGGKVTAEEAKQLLSELYIPFTPPAIQLPSINLVNTPSLFPRTQVANLNYDKLIFDTYDFLDKVVSFSLTDPLCAALTLYAQRNEDERAVVMVNFIKHGTNDATEIMLLRYGFDVEDIEWIKEHVEKVDEGEIIFMDTIKDLEESKVDIIERYIF